MARYIRQPNEEKKRKTKKTIRPGKLVFILKINSFVGFVHFILRRTEQLCVCVVIMYMACPMEKVFALNQVLVC